MRQENPTASVRKIQGDSVCVCVLHILTAMFNYDNFKMRWDKDAYELTLYSTHNKSS